MWFRMTRFIVMINYEDIMDIIKSKYNSKIKYVKNLNLKKFRDEERAFVVEGIKFVDEAVKEGADIKFLLLSEDVHSKDEIKEIIEIVDENKVVVCSQQVFSSAADTVSTQGILAVINKGAINKEDVINKYKFIGLE